jgi:hypothetical protein
MQKAGIDMYCSSAEDWARQIERYTVQDDGGKNSIMDAAKNYLASTHTREIICDNWDAIFESVIQ